MRYAERLVLYIARIYLSRVSDATIGGLMVRAGKTARLLLSPTCSPTGGAPRARARLRARRVPASRAAVKSTTTSSATDQASARPRFDARTTLPRDRYDRRNVAHERRLDMSTARARRHRGDVTRATRVDHVSASRAVRWCRFPDLLGRFRTRDAAPPGGRRAYRFDG